MDDGKGIMVSFVTLANTLIGLLSKSKSIDVRRNLLLWIEDYLSNQIQRDVISNTCSDWQFLKKLFVDDTTCSLYLILDNPPDTANDLNVHLQKIEILSNSKLQLAAFSPHKHRVFHEDYYFLCV